MPQIAAGAKTVPRNKTVKAAPGKPSKAMIPRNLRLLTKPCFKA